MPPGASGCAGLGELVAGDEEGDARAGARIGARLARPTPRRPARRARVARPLAERRHRAGMSSPSAPDIVAPASVSAHAEPASLHRRRSLDRHHGVGALGQHGPGRNPHRLTRRDRARRTDAPPAPRPPRRARPAGPATTANPSIAELSKGGTGRVLATSSASTRPSAASSATGSSPRRVHGREHPPAGLVDRDQVAHGRNLLATMPTGGPPFPGRCTIDPSDAA